MDKIDETLAAKWIENPATEQDAAWNALLLLYKELFSPTRDIQPYAIAQVIAEILGVFENDSDR